MNIGNRVNDQIMGSLDEEGVHNNGELLITLTYKHTEHTNTGSQIGYWQFRDNGEDRNSKNVKWIV